jgi:hypothetical protein
MIHNLTKPNNAYKQNCPKIEAKQHMTFVIFHISKSIKPKILKFLPDIIHHKSNIHKNFISFGVLYLQLLKITYPTRIQHLVA